ncbi:MAG: glycosyltransferase [Candidatus Eisenbacteria bacterium]|nr:glycosyltransferase [Candidatus Eisenbacteria bacterium]
MAHDPRSPAVALLGGSLRLGGAEGQAIHLLEWLVRSRFDPFLILKTREGDHLERAVDLGVPIYELGFHRLYTPAGLAAVKRLRAILQRHDAAILQSYLYGSHIAGTLALLGLTPRPRHILALRGHHLRRPYILKPFYTWAGRRADAAVAVSDDLARAAVGWGIPAERIQTIPNGVPPPPDDAAELRRRWRERWGIPAESLLAGMVGNLRPGKGHADLLRALAVVEEPSWRLVLVGDGRMRAAMEELAAELGIGERVLFAGFLPAVRECLPALDLFVFPSHSEGMPNALLEAMAAGLPCLASDIPVHREILKDERFGRLAPPGRPAELAEALRTLLQAPAAERRGLGAAAARRIREAYSADVMVRAYEALYDRLLAS